MKKRDSFKIIVILLNFLIFNRDVFSKIERYKLEDLNGVEVYFPKDNRTYIDEIISSADSDKFLYLAELYLEMREEELALYYFNSYKGVNWEFREKIANKLGIDTFTKEFQKDIYSQEPEFTNYFSIKSVDSLDEYLNYFSLKGNKEKNIYEKLFKYKYEKKMQEFLLLYEELNKSVNEKNILEEVFVFQLLKENYEEGKKTAFLKPQLFMDLILFMNLNGADKTLIKEYINQFKIEFKGKYEKEILNFEMKYLLNDAEKLAQMEKFLNNSFDEEIFEGYFKVSKNIDFLKKYLIDLVFEKGHEKYINYLISLDKTYEDEAYLKKLFDKSYFFRYLEKNEKSVEEIYKNEYTEYLYELKNYKKLFEYKNELNFEMLKALKNNGFEVDEIIKKKYSLELEFADLNNLKFFYFNTNLVFDEVLVKDLERQKQLNSVETYYLSRYYKSKGEHEKALELQYGLKNNYNFKN